MSKTLSGQMRSAEYNGWRNFVTLDESRFCHDTEYESIQLAGHERAVQREWRMMASQ
jgi:hypothetical protein